MESKEIQESNKLIAEFMGWDATKYSIPLNLRNHKPFGEYFFNSSWEWLMPVVDKCRRAMFEYEVIEAEMGDNEMIEGLLKVDMAQVYIGVIKFIKWYNENQES